MAYKTMLRQLISKWGIMSIDMVSAMDADMAVINEDGSKDYVENDDSIIDMQPTKQEEPDVPGSQAEPTQEQEAPQDAQAALFGNN